MEREEIPAMLQRLTRTGLYGTKRGFLTPDDGIGRGRLTRNFYSFHAAIKIDVNGFLKRAKRDGFPYGAIPLSPFLWRSFWQPSGVSPLPPLLARRLDKSFAYRLYRPTKKRKERLEGRHN